MPLFKKPTTLSDEEVAARHAKIKAMNISKKEERLMIWTALKIFIPAILATLFIVWFVVIFFVWIL